MSERISQTRNGLEEPKEQAGETEKERITNFEHDISECKQAEASLMVDQILLNALMDMLPDPVYFKDTHSRFIKVNKAQAAWLGVGQPDHAIGKTACDIFTEEYAQQASLDEQEIMRTGRPIVAKEEKETWADGKETWISVTKAPLRDQDGQIIGTFGISRDITERKRIEQEWEDYQEHLEQLVEERTAELTSANAQLRREIIERQQAENALAEERNLLRTVINHLPDLIYVKDPESRFITGNTAMMDSVNVASLEDLCGKTDFDFHPQESATAYYADEQKIFESGEPLLNREETIFDQRTHDTTWLLTTKIPFRDNRQNIAGLIGIGRNITNLKRAEEELQTHRDHLEELVRARTAEFVEERHLLRTLIDNMPDLILIKDAESRFLMLNPALARLMGAATPEDLLGKTDFEWYPRAIAQQYYDLEQSILESGEACLNQEELHHDPDTGEACWFLATKIPFRDQHGVIRGLVGISRDITAHKQLEKELRDQRDHLESLTAELAMANRELKDFAYVVSHDLKAPLRAISRLVAWIVEDYAGDFDAKGKDMADLLIGRVKRMDNFIDGILEYSRIGRIVGQNTEIDLDMLLKGVIDTLAPPPTIQIDYACQLPVLVGDATRIAQVFQNLIGNAVKFIGSPQGLIRIRCSDTGAYWQFSVSDNGPGIDEKYHERIF